MGCISSHGLLWNGHIYVRENLVVFHKAQSRKSRYCNHLSREWKTVTDTTDHQSSVQNCNKSYLSSDSINAVIHIFIYQVRAFVIYWLHALKVSVTSFFLINKIFSYAQVCWEIAETCTPFCFDFRYSLNGGVAFLSDVELVLKLYSRVSASSAQLLKWPRISRVFPPGISVVIQRERKVLCFPSRKVCFSLFLTDWFVGDVLSALFSSLIIFKGWNSMFHLCWSLKFFIAMGGKIRIEITDLKLEVSGV